MRLSVRHAGRMLAERYLSVICRRRIVVVPLQRFRIQTQWEHQIRYPHSQHGSNSISPIFWLIGTLSSNLHLTPGELTKFDDLPGRLRSAITGGESGRPMTGPRGGARNRRLAGRGHWQVVGAMGGQWDGARGASGQSLDRQWPARRQNSYSDPPDGIHHLLKDLGRD